MPIVKRFKRAWRGFFEDAPSGAGLGASFSSAHQVAGGSGRWPMNASLWAPVNQTEAAARLARHRVAYIAKNSPLCASIILTFVTAAVADGPTAKSNLADADEAADLERRWNAWAAQCDVEGICDLGGYLSRIVQGWLIDGEAFTHLVVLDDELKLRYLAADQVDSNYTRVLGSMVSGTSPRIIRGIEVDEQGRRVGYWILPSQLDVAWAVVGPPTFFPAADICHMHEPAFAGQLRGMSPLAPVAPRLLQLDQTEDAACQKVLINALMTGFIRGDNADNFGGLTAGDATTGFDPSQLSMEPGALRVLPFGTDVTFTPTIDMTTITDIIKHMGRSACAGAAVPFILASGDLSETNFSSAQVGIQNFKRRIRAFQQNNLVAQVLAPIWRRFVLLEVLMGRIEARNFEADPASYLTAKWIFPGWPALDPLKQAKADVLELNGKLRSRTEIAAEHGRDISEINAEIENDLLAPDLTQTASAALAQPEVNDNANA